MDRADAAVLTKIAAALPDLQDVVRLSMCSRRLYEVVRGADEAWEPFVEEARGMMRGDGAAAQGGEAPAAPPTPRAPRERSSRGLSAPACAAALLCRWYYENASPWRRWVNAEIRRRRAAADLREAQGEGPRALPPWVGEGEGEDDDEDDDDDGDDDFSDSVFE